MPFDDSEIDEEGFVHHEWEEVPDEELYDPNSVGYSPYDEYEDWDEDEYEDYNE